MYLKRQNIPKKWPLPRKGTAYVVKPRFDIEGGIPLLVVLRDILKIAQSAKEVKKAVNSGKILLNTQITRDEKVNAILFDTLSIIPSGKFYRIELSEKGKFEISEIDERNSKDKISKIIGKKILKNGKVQLNLHDGKNFLSEIKCKVNDSVFVDLEKKKIEKLLPLKEGAEVLVFDGKHSGKTGVMEKLDINKKMAELKAGKEKINVLINQLIVTK